MDFSMSFDPVSAFQFHEGPIKTRAFLYAANKTNCFNSMKVRLKQDSYLVDELEARFQFHEGPIKTVQDEAMLPDFKVFQFHEGPIKTGLL